MTKLVIWFQKHARGFITRCRLNKIYRAVSVIQGYFKMKWMRSMFQRMRKSALIIQRRVYTHLAIKRANQSKYDRYILPWEIQLQAQKLREQKHLFGDEEQDSPERSIDISCSPNLNLSPFSYQSNISMQPSPARSKHHENQTPLKRKTQEKSKSFDEILGREDPSIDPKISLFAFVVDLEIFIDTSDYFTPTWSSSYKTLFEQQYTSCNPIQTLHAGVEHCFATTSNGKLYSWGSNEYNQCGVNKKTHNIHKLSTEAIPGRIVQVESGADHTLFLTQQGRLYAAGSNSQGQLMGDQQSYDIKEFEFASPIKSMSSTYNTTITLGEDGKVHTWPVRNDLGEFLDEPLQLSIPVGNLIQMVSCGNRFALLLTQHGTLFSFGENSEGELGLGHLEPQIHPTLLPTKNLTFHQISCGFKHSLAATSFGKAYTWGWGQCGQLGNGRFDNILEPQIVDLPDQITQVHATYKSSILLIDSKTILWCGSNGTINYQCTFTNLKLTSKIQQLQQSHFSIVRLMSTFSRSYSLIYFTYAQHKYMFKNQPAKERGILHTLTNHWIQKGIKTIDPPQIDSIVNYISEKHMKKQQAVNPSHQPHLKNNSSSKSLMQQDSNQNSGQLKVNLSRIKEQDSIDLDSSNLKMNSYLLRYEEPDEPQKIEYQTQLIPTQQSDSCLLESSFVSYQKLQELRNSRKEITDTKTPLKDKPEQIQTQLEQKFDDQEEEKHSLTQQKRLNFFSSKPIKSPSQKTAVETKQTYTTKILKPHTKKGAKFLNERRESHKQSKNQVDSQLSKEVSRSNTSSTVNLFSKSSKPEREQEDHTESKIKKLRDMKERLISLKQVPQNQWSSLDHEFLKSMYSSNLSVLLEL